MDKYEYLWLCIRGNHLPGDISRGEYEYSEIMKMSTDGLIHKLAITKKAAEYIMSTKEEYDVEFEYDRFLRSGASAVTIRENNYPARLRYIDNSPYALIYYGKLPENHKRHVAIIGARKCTDYGRIMAEEIAAGLAKENVTVVSGMAYGIDGIAQMSAINNGGYSIAVTGSGVDICYPRANRPIYDRLLTEGCILSEYAIGAPAKSENFPMRNRIISGLSDVIIVVEARLKSGTFITVDYALMQGREVMIVPGRATDPLSMGCNALLFQGANPVQSSDDVMRLLDTISPDFYIGRNGDNSFRTKELSEYIPKPSEKILLEREENMVYSVLDFYALSPEDIQNRVDMDIFQVMNVLVSLELKGLIKESGKNMYVKCKK